MDDDGTPPEGLQTVVDAFRGVPPALRLELLLEYARSVPPLPEPYRSDPSALERVHECQTPFFVATEIDGGRVRLFFDAPEESPTTRGFAGILHRALDGERVERVLATPADFYLTLGLGEVISPLRLRGMDAILTRIKRQLRGAERA